MCVCVCVCGILHQTNRHGGDVSATGPRSENRPGDVNAALEWMWLQRETVAARIQEEPPRRRWWGEQRWQQGERVSYRLQRQFTKITINFVLTVVVYETILHHVGPKSLVCGAEPEQVPFCSGSVAEALKKVTLVTQDTRWRLKFRLVKRFLLALLR